MERKDNISSCIMIAANLITPVSLASVFETEDLFDTGINFDSHITMLYASGIELSKFEVKRSIEGISTRSTTLDNPGPDGLYNYLEKLSKNSPTKVLDLFDLSSFENDSGYVVLKLKKSTGLFNILSEFHEGLKEDFKVKTTFKDYNPHITLAELNSGLSKKYLSSKVLNSVLKESWVRFEDVILSIGEVGKKDFDVTNLTVNRAVDRYFRERYLRKLAKDLEE